MHEHGAVGQQEHRAGTEGGLVGQGLPRLSGRDAGSDQERRHGDQRVSPGSHEFTPIFADGEDSAAAGTHIYCRGWRASRQSDSPQQTIRFSGRLESAEPVGPRRPRIRGIIAVPMFDLRGPVQYVKGVGPQRAEALVKAGVRTVEDLLHYLPLRYEDRRQFARIADLRAGMKIAVAGQVAVAGLRRARRMSLYEIRLDDGSGRLKALWFNQPFLRDSLLKGRRAVLFGIVERDSYGGAGLMMSSPQWELVEDEDTPGVHTGRIVPVYERLGPLSGKALRRILTLLAKEVPDDLDDPMPPDLRARLAVVRRGEAR